MTKNAIKSTVSSLSPVWLVPLVALLLGLWMLYQYQSNKGIEILITADNAEGIVVGKTEIRVRSVNVGTVKGIRLNQGHDHVLISAQIQNQYQGLLKSDTQIWMVKPRVDLTGVSGLGTLLSGVYLELQPGQLEASSENFELLDRPPLISNEVNGKRYTLNSFDNNELDIGTGVFYHNYRVGQVESAVFDLENKGMQYGIFIYAPYDELVTDNVLFWQKAGVEFNLSADGINFKAGSMAQILKGGIAFKVPDREQAGDKAESSTEFTLGASYQQALEQRFQEYEYILLNFEQSVRGLKAGAPVEYRGIRIGTVVDSPARISSQSLPMFLSVTEFGVPVLIKIEYRRIHYHSETAKNYWKDNVESWVKQGLRASIKPGNLLTGANYIDLDIYPNSQPGDIELVAGYRVLPTVSSGLTELSNQVSSILNKLERLDIEKSLSDLSSTLVAFEQLSDNVNRLVVSNETQRLPKDFVDAIASLQQSMDGFDATMQNYDANSQFMVEIYDLLEQFKRISQDIQPVVKGLNQQPNMLIFDKRLPNDAVPPKGN